MTSVSTECEGRFLGVKPIDASEEDLESLRKVLDSKVSDCVKNIKLEQVLGSWCIICGGVLTKIATYDYVGATVIRRYCSERAEKQFAREQVV